MTHLFRTTFISATILLNISVNCHAFFGQDKPIKLEEVPETVMVAAKKKLENFIPESTEKEISNKQIEYEIEGSSNGKRYSVTVKVNKAGDIIDIEVEEEDD